METIGSKRSYALTWCMPNNDDDDDDDGVARHSIEHLFNCQKPYDATHSARPMGQSGHGRRLPQPGQLRIREQLLGITTTT